MKEINNFSNGKGYVGEPIADSVDLAAEIRRLCEEKRAVILAHYYTPSQVQDAAHFVGDSLALAQKAAEQRDARIIVMCGVHFMGETVKILCPDKKVLTPDLNAGCSLADSCPADEFRAFIARHPGHQVVSYVNTSAAVKALTDVVVTSGNAERVINSFPKDTPIIFGPDRNLGAHINEKTGRHMVLWDGGCHVHARFSAEGVARLKRERPDAPVLVHPECPEPLRRMADVVGSTARLLSYASASEASEFIVATECGILHKLNENCPGKTFWPAPSDQASCNECEHMKLNTLAKLYLTLLREWPEVNVDPRIAERAAKPIRRMLELSRPTEGVAKAAR